MINFKEPYNQNELIQFFTTLLPDFKEENESIQIGRNFKYIKSINKIGASKSLDIKIYEIEHESDHDPRVSLSRESFLLLKDFSVHKALVIFKTKNSQDYRLSLITFESTWETGTKVESRFSNPRRFSFFLGPDAKVNTPKKFLIDKGSIIDFEDLKNRFSIEIVNKEFYKEISKQFTELINGLLKLPSTQDKSQTNQEFAVRLIGRIIFCWFLREKKSEAGIALMPKDLLSLKAVQENNDYYHKILEPIFFEILNRPIKSRREEFIKEPFSYVPYLNGGLFSPQDDDYYKRLNGDLQSQFQNTLIIPDEWLTSFFEILETYNFTIDENTSYDEELSIDPEMLGRIFENLLAEINPETGESARKSTGSYYTPRTIVNYMVDESLLLYLKEQTGIKEEKLRAIVSYDLNDDSENPIGTEEKEKIIEALEKVKILDPACGSGAFPIGALQKIVFILQQTDSDGQLWFKKQIKNTSPEVKRVIEREFEHKNFDYIRKLGIIRENIYGVDIQSIATEISRLRCFLTLIVDERIQDESENRGIEPLPNLDFKFVTANSLVGLPKLDTNNSQQALMFDDRDNIDELKNIRDQYFNSSGIEREQLKLQFSEQQKILIKQMYKEHGFAGMVKAELTQKLTDWEPFTHKPTMWFDSEWMFGLKDQFDIVIANPPYIDSEGMVKNNLESLREYIVKNYNFTRGNWDIYIAFFEKGFQNLKNGGVLTYISPDKWISKPFGTKLRENKYLSLFSILKAGRNVFQSAKVDSIVSLFYNNIKTDNLKVFEIRDEKIMYVRDYDKSKLKPPYALDCVFSKHLNIIEKIDKFLIKDKTLNCENACATSDAYKLSPLLNELVGEFNKNTSLKIINTGTISKWTTKWGKSEMTYLGKKYQRPVVNKYEFLTIFKNSYSAKSIKPKLILKGLNLLDVCLDPIGEYIPGKSTLIISGHELDHLKLIMAYLNSPLPSFYIKEKYPSSSYNQGISFTKDMINNLPISPIIFGTKDRFIKIVDKILKETESVDYYLDSQSKKLVLELEKEINQMVYKLYGLTPKEIGIIEENQRSDR